MYIYEEDHIFHVQGLFQYQNLDQKRRKYILFFIVSGPTAGELEPSRPCHFSNRKIKEKI